MADIQQAREILLRLPESDKIDFINKFKMLDSDEKRQIAIDRLLERTSKQFIESKTPVFGATQVIPKSPIGVFGRFRLATGTPEGRRQILQKQFGEVYGQPKREIVKTRLGYQAVNPRGFDIGDIPEFAADIPTITGGVSGGIIGAPSIVGSAAMAGLGTFAGENIKNILGKIMGTRPDTKAVNDINAALKEGVKVGAIQLAFGAGVKALGKIKGVPEATEQIMQRIGNIKQRTSTWLKDRLKYTKAKDIFTKEKMQPEYANAILNPKIREGFIKNLENYSDDTAKMLKEFNASDESIKILKSTGYKDIKNVQSKISVDNIVDDIYKGVEDKRNIADITYKKVMQKIDKNNIFKINKTYNYLENTLQKYNLIDELGNTTQRAETITDPVYKNLVRMYQDMKLGLTTEGKTIAIGGIRKADFELYRDQLNRLYSDAPSSVIVRKLKDNLYADLENAGFAGIKDAVRLQREAFNAEDNLFSKGLVNRNKLININKLSTQELDKLKGLQQYTGKNYINDLKKLSTAEEIDTIFEKQLSQKNIETLFNQAQNEQKTFAIDSLKKLNDTLPKENRFFRDFQDYLISMDFQDIGIYTSQAGLRRFGVEQGVKNFYRFILPQTQKLGRFQAQLEPYFEKTRGFGRFGKFTVPSLINEMQRNEVE